MQTLKTLAFSLIILLLVVAMHRYYQSIKKYENLERLSLISTQMECEAEGGNIQKVCKFGRPMCIVPNADSGKKCIGSNECEGECRTSYHGLERTLFISGKCSSDNNPCGCWSSVENGRVVGSICKD